MGQRQEREMDLSLVRAARSQQHSSVKDGKEKITGEIAGDDCQNFHLVFFSIKPETWQWWPQHGNRIINDDFLLGTFWQYKKVVTT